MKLRFHTERRPLKIRFDGRRSFGFGAQCGWWPCLLAPYVSLIFLFWRFDLWFGLAPQDCVAHKDHHARVLKGQ